MDTTLVSVTLLSMAMASSLSVIVWRLVRDDRRRSDARVRALAELAAKPEPPPARRHEPRREPRREPRVATPVPRRHSLERRAPLDLPLNAPDAAPRPAVRSEPRALSAAPLFAEPAPSSPWGTRAAIMGGIALAVAAVILFVLAARTGSDMRSALPRGPVARASAPATIDLLSLRDSRQGTQLTISGVVQNPRDGSPLTRIVVTAYTFDKDGAPLANGHAYVEAQVLAPGEESPFAVAVPASDAVARYRIGFRTEDGRIISHVDRRQQGTIAANW